MKPVTKIIDIVKRFIVVNILLSIVDSLTPTDNNNVNSKTIANAKKSGYSDKNETLIGKAAFNAVSIVRFVKTSM